MWKKLILVIVGLVILVPGGVYLGALDWQRGHSNYVASLPMFSEQTSDGEYRVKIGEMTFRVRAAGLQNSGPNVLLLHGFPESSKIWEGLMTEAAQKGFRLIAFDQRGYSPGARPSGADNYRIPLLIKDVFAMADAVGFNNFHLAGHDWGAVVGWFTVMDHPERINSWSALSIPHAGAFFRGAVMDPEQSKRSGYVAFLQRPLVPEFVFTMRSQKSLKDMFSSVPAQNREEYIRIHSEPGALTAALNWYRALDLETVANDPAYRKPISRPTLLVWGKKDLVIAETVVAKARELMPEDYTEVALDTGHALLQHAPDEVIPAVIQHWQAHPPK